MEQHVFYVVYFEDRRLQRSLDAIRFIADPSAKMQAHITVRGPYPQRYGLSRRERIVRGSEITALGVDCFFNERQNTIFIRCDSEALRQTVEKKHFGYNPHITLYDGTSREFAADLLERLKVLDMRFSFLADGLTPLISVKGQGTLDLQLAVDEDFVARMLGKPISVQDIPDLKLSERLDFIELLARRLPEFALRGSEQEKHAAQQGVEPDGRSAPAAAHNQENRSPAPCAGGNAEAAGRESLSRLCRSGGR